MSRLAYTTWEDSLFMIIVSVSILIIAIVVLYAVVHCVPQ